MSTFRLAVSYVEVYGTGQRPPLPVWLEPSRNVTHLSGGGTSFRYWTKLYWATPPWLTPELYDQMKAIYDSAAPDEHVDHIVPLKHPIVCGLHVPWNLRVINEKKNLVKSNAYWEDAPFQQTEMYGNPDDLPDHMWAEAYRKTPPPIEEPRQLCIFDVDPEQSELKL